MIAEEAGARFFNFDGGRSIRGGNAILCVPALEREIRGLLESLRTRDLTAPSAAQTSPGLQATVVQRSVSKMPS